jgi:uncharacterized membrane protein
VSFFALILTFFAFLHAPLIRRAPGLATTRDKACYAAAFAFLFTGVSHFANPARFIEMMPPFIPAHAEMVMISGAAEIAGAVGLMIPATRRAAGIGLLALLIAVFPANVYVAMAGKTIEGMPSSSWYYWVRLPFQYVYIVWIYLFAVRRAPRAA